MAREPAALVAKASDQVEAQIWLAALRDAGIEAATFEVGVGAALGGAVTGIARFPILVARRDLAGARNVIADLDGAARLAPVPDPIRTQRHQRQALGMVLGSGAVILVVAIVARLLSG